MTPRPFEDPVHVLAHARWLEALARGLVDDPGRAADLVQDTQLAALHARPDSDRPLRGWLATVMRNFLRQERRSDLRRAAHEQAGAEREEVPPSDALAARLEAHRRVVDAVAALEEPYRTTILLRYFEARSPKRIAADQGVPLATVKTRLQRGLALLRRRLDRDYGGDGRSWAIALVPLTSTAEATLAAAGMGALLMNVKLVTAAAILAAGAGLYLFTRTEPASSASGREGSQPSPMPSSAAEPPVLDVSGAKRLPASGEAPADVTRTQSPKDATTPAKAEPAVAERARGRVLDVQAQPAAGIELRFVVNEGKDPDDTVELKTLAPVVSGQDGSFDVEAPADWSRIVAAGPNIATVFAAARGFGGQEGLVVVIANAVAYSGVVVDESDRPVAGASIELRLPHGFRTRFTQVLDTASEQPLKRESAADGRFAFERAPEIDGATLGASRIGFETALAPARAGGATDLRLVMRRPLTAESRVEGVVVDPAGALVEGAYVSLRGEITVTDASGRFALDVDDANWMRRLAERFGAPPEEVARHLGAAGLGRDSPLGAKIVAVKAGHQPGVHAAQVTANGPSFPSYVILQLGPEPMAIEGTVLGPDGAPAAGVKVWVDDPAIFGMLDTEGEALIENLVVGKPGFEWRAASTDDEGRFRLDGLLDRSYRLVAMDERLLRVAKPGVAAGSTDAVLRFPADAYHSEIRGRVLTLRDKPVAGAYVRVQNDAFHVGGSTQHAGGESVETDKEGRFTLKDVPREGVYLRVDGEGILPIEYGREKPRLEDESDRPVTELVLRVSARCHLQLELSDGELISEFSVADKDGNLLPIDLFQGNSRETRDRFGVVDGRSPVVAVPQDTVWVVLYRDRKEVRRIPVELVDGEVNTIEG